MGGETEKEVSGSSIGCNYPKPICDPKSKSNYKFTNVCLKGSDPVYMGNPDNIKVLGQEATHWNEGINKRIGPFLYIISPEKYHTTVQQTNSFSCLGFE